MVLDASAIVAILAGEAEAAQLAGRIGKADRICVSPIAIYEATLALARIAGSATGRIETMIDRFMDEIGAESLPVTAEIGRAAVRAFARYGKGHHKAALNMGDCFAYAAAATSGDTLLFKGNDFSQTDIAAA
jgi:ribonuclease VapC